MIEVKYRSNLFSYLAQQKKEGEKSELAQANEKWPNLCLVFVTDRAKENRSCFQALDLSTFEAGKLLRTVDLHEIRRFDLFPQNIEQHEDLARKLFGLLSEIKVSAK